MACEPDVTHLMKTSGAKSNIQVDFCCQIANFFLLTSYKEKSCSLGSRVDNEFRYRVLVK